MVSDIPIITGPTTCTQHGYVSDYQLKLTELLSSTK